MRSCWTHAHSSHAVAAALGCPLLEAGEITVLEAAGAGNTPGIAVHPLKGVEAADKIMLASRNFGPLSTVVVTKLVGRYRPQLHEFAIPKNPILAEGASRGARARPCTRRRARRAKPASSS